MNAAMRIVRLFAPVHSPTQTWKALVYAIKEMEKKEEAMFVGRSGSVSRPDHFVICHFRPVYTRILNSAPSTADSSSQPRHHGLVKSIAMSRRTVPLSWPHL